VVGGMAEKKKKKKKSINDASNARKTARSE